MRYVHFSCFSHVSNSKTWPRNLVPANVATAACTSSADGKVATPVPLPLIEAYLHSPPFWSSSFNFFSASTFLSRSSMVGKLPIQTRFSGFSLQPPPLRPLPPPL